MEPNTLYYGDNLPVLREHFPNESVDLIYLDPPFNSNRNYNVLFKENAATASPAQIEAFEDTWSWPGGAAQRAFEEVTQHGTDDTARLLNAMLDALGHNDVTAYLSMMAVRLIELHRVLKPTGSIYLHCDPTAGHYLKVLMDSIFGPECFRNEIIWRRTGAHGPRRSYGPIHDVLLFYTKHPTRYFFRVEKRRYMLGHVTGRYKEDSTGQLKFTSGGNVLTGAGKTGGESGAIWKGFDPSVKNRHWAVPGFLSAQMDEGFQKLGVLAKLDALYAAGLVEIVPGTAWPTPIRYLNADDGQPLSDLWTFQPYTAGTVTGTKDGIDEDVKWLGPTDPDRLGYPTQKPLGLLERIIKSSCPSDGIVLDPFCGCGTAVHAAHKLGRKWIGIDITFLAIGLIEQRMRDAFPGITFHEVGVPADVPGAEALAARDPYQFQFWAVHQLGGRSESGKNKKGADKGVDGIIPFMEGATDYRRVIVSVKAGNIQPAYVQQLKGVVEGQGAPMGVLVTLKEPTKAMRTEAVSAGIYHSDRWGKDYRRIQLLTAAEIIAGKRVDMPPQVSPFAQAARETERGEQTTLI